MVTTVNVHEAKTHLSRLLEAVETGEDVVITRATPVARPVPAGVRTKPRTPGSWRGRVYIADDFDETPEELIAAFHGDADS